jgi:hypothetical protein
MGTIRLQPSITGLPFANMSDIAEQEFFRVHHALGAIHAGAEKFPVSGFVPPSIWPDSGFRD